jgi:adenylate cyclase
VATLSVLLFRYGIVDQQRRRIQVAFRHYLAPEMVQALAAHPDRLQLGGETRMLSVMFCDIRGFTAISEQFQANPQGLSRLINRGFLSPMTAIIMSHRGTIDKYIGDCIMAFWNAPLDDPAHADRACASALAMVAALDRINDELAAEAHSDQRPFVPLHIGIGINSGTCVVGNMGSEERFAYTAMGDAVNLAARLEGQTKYYHVTIIIGEATRQAAPTWAALELDVIAVQGKQEAVRIYALLGDERLACSPAFAAHARSHEGMLACYRQQDWAAAAAALATCRGGMAALAAFYDLYEQRIAFYRDNPPGPGWDGIFVAETK